MVSYLVVIKAGRSSSLFTTRNLKLQSRNIGVSTAGMIAPLAVSAQGKVYIA